MKYAIKITPKEQALDIYNKFYHLGFNNKESIECLLVCVDEIISNCNEFGKLEGTTYGLLDYWEEVKQEIKLL